MGLIFFSAFVLWIIWLLIIRPINKRRLKRAFDLKTRNCKYSLYHDRTGIALNPKERKIVLANSRLLKEYDFGDIRKWESCIQTGGMSVGSTSVAGGLLSVADNVAQVQRNLANTGMTIITKDLDHVRWFIKFPSGGIFINRETQNSIALWHEILTQYINEGREY